MNNPASPRIIVLVDDDGLIQTTWKIYCRLQGVELYVFSSVEAALVSQVVAQLPRSSDTWIVVDSDLGPGVPRGEVSSRGFKDLGFSQIWIATGHLLQEIQISDWICGVRGKEPWF